MARLSRAYQDGGLELWFRVAQREAQLESVYLSQQTSNQANATKQHPHIKQVGRTEST
jgi:hypothetical protein